MAGRSKPPARVVRKPDDPGAPAPEPVQPAPEPVQPAPAPVRAGGHIDRGDGRGWVVEE